jgi:cation transport protein ChaC
VNDAENGAGEGTWIFGYGSLVWRPGFPHRTCRAAFVRGWRRRYWQGSTDHRGVPGAPGRVVTLVEEPAHGACWGMAYQVAPEDQRDVFAALDHREKGGYDRVSVDLHFSDGASDRATSGLMYVATDENPNYLGPAPLEMIANQVLASHGPSGPNPEYVVRLAEALRTICPGLDANAEDALALAALLPGNASSREPRS